MDSNKIAQIADVMEDRGLTRVRVEEPDGSAFELERGAAQAPAPVVVAPQAVSAEALLAAGAAVPAAAPEAAAVQAPAAEAEPEPAEPAGTEVKAPMVGVYYASPAPGADPFVHVGSKVRKGETLCIIEAMKIMNEIKAPCDGKVIRIMAQPGDMVEYNQVLCVIE